MFTRILSVGLLGLDAYTVEVEAFISKGMPAFDVVGLPDTAVRESRDRVRAAIKNCGFDYPPAHITVNLAPADVRKEGAIYDLPLMLALLCATEQIPQISDRYAFVGALSLDGQVRRIDGVLPMVIYARQIGLDAIFVPADNAPEASVVEGIECYAINTVGELLMHLFSDQRLSPVKREDYDDPIAEAVVPDFAEVRGQEVAKRAMEIAAAGGHNILLIGSPGSGKSMLAKRLPSILPDMTFEESIETTKIHSVSGTLPPGAALIRTRPFRSPHHNASAASMAGGGRIPSPGEVSLAHNGVLFLDELPEFSTQASEILRQPLEDGVITISRAAGHLTYPCSIQLVAAMNPCRCGYFGHPTRPCTCSDTAVQKYLDKVSGPLLDRIDLHVEVPPVDYEQLSSDTTGETSAQIRERVNAARRIQQERFADCGITCNARITPALLHKACPITDRASALLRTAFERMGFSGRAYDRVLKVSRTIADLEGADVIDTPHVAEAVQYRSLDRKYWRR